MDKTDKIIAQILGLNEAELKDDISMDNFGAWDSLRNMDLIVELENAYSFEFSFDEISEMTSVGKIRDVVSKKVNL